MKISLTVLLPAFNEQDNLELAFDNVLRAVDGLVSDLEIIVIDDGSHDNTGLIAKERAAKDSRVRYVVNPQNMGYGYSYRRGVALATKDYVGVYTSDNDMSWESFRDLLINIERADIVSPYTSNTHDRPVMRRFFSASFTLVMNVLFGLKMKYFNGPFIARRGMLQKLDIRSTGLTVLAECKVKLMRQGCTCTEIPFIHIRRQGGTSSALRFKSIYAAFAAIWHLFQDIYFKKPKT